MKNILPWFKSNWPIVVLGLIAVVALPVLWYFSSAWNKKLVDQLQTTVNDDVKSVTNVKNVYKLTGLTGESLLEKNAPINRNLTTAYEEIAKQMLAQSAKVGQTAVDFNKGTGPGEHKILIEGLFPEPANPLEATLKPNQFVAEYVRRHPQMLKAINAGMPPLASEMVQQLAEMQSQKVEQYRQERGTADIDSASRKALAEEMLGFRLGRYQSRAAEIQVYADASVFVGTPIQPLEKPLSLAQSWDYQERFWIHSDILAAIARANGDSRGKGVPGSIVKRIIRVETDRAAFEVATDGRPTPVAYIAGTDKAPSEFSRSITGRFSGPGSTNKWYDVRNVKIEIIADSRELPKFIDALAAINFMTLVHADITKAQPLDDLANGFYYGDANVVQATLTIETIWFREWRKDPRFTPDDNNKAEAWRQWIMPKDVQDAMGMTEGIGADAPPASAPAPSRAKPAAAGAKGAGDDDLSGAGRGRRNRGGGD